jgi:hypothetical protein
MLARAGGLRHALRVELVICLLVGLVLLVLAAPGVRASGRAASEMTPQGDRPIEPAGFSPPRDEGRLL